jgi:hypothetical protein
MHAEVIWDSAHKHDFKYYIKHIREWQDDHKFIRENFSLKMLYALYGTHFKKWKAKGEKKLVKAWKKAWEGRQMTRAHANQFSELGGGIPCDNGRVEDENRWFKDKIGRYVRPCYRFIDALAQQIRKKSMDDLSWTNGWSVQVTGLDFYTKVFKLTGELGQPAIQDRTSEEETTSGCSSSSASGSDNQSIEEDDDEEDNDEEDDDEEDDGKLKE